MIALQYRRLDGSFVAVVNGLPYHVTEDDPLFQAAQGAADEMGEDLPLEPSPPDPEPVGLRPLTARQLRLGLITNGITLGQVGSTIEAIEDAQDRTVAQVEWEYASQFERDHPLIAQVGAALGLTDGQIDAMWQQASAL